MDGLEILETGKNALRNVCDVTLLNLPNLVELCLEGAFGSVKEVMMENTGVLENYVKLKAAKRREEEEKRRREDGVVLNVEDWENLPNDVTTISVNACSDYKKEVLDLSRFTKLRELKIASQCFQYVSQVQIVGLSELKNIRIGEGAFQSNNKDSLLQIKNCPSFLSLSIGNESFKSFSQWEMSGVKSLQNITMGCGCFREANCVVKEMNDLNTLKLGDLCFEKSRHTVIESGVSFNY